VDGALLEALGEAIFAHIPGGRFIHATRVACERLGWTREELLGQTPNDILAPEERPFVDRWVGSTLQLGRCHIETVLLCKDGRKVPADLEATRCDIDGHTCIMSVWKKKPPTAEGPHQVSLSRREFDRFMDRLPAAAYIKDAEGRTLYFNRFMREVLGADDSWLGKRTDELWPGPLGQAMREADIEAAKLGFKECEEAVPRADGLIHEYKTQKFVIPCGEGPPLLGGISVDITDQKNAVRALAASETKLRVIFECAGDGIVLVDPRTRQLVAVNQRFADMLGYTREEAVHLRVDDFHPPETTAQVIAEFGKDTTSEIPRHREILLRRKDGSTVFASLISTPVVLPEGTLQLGIIRDVTDERAAQEAMRQSEAKFRTLFEGAGDGIVLVVNSTKKISAVNQRLANRLGYRPEELLGMTVEQLHPPEDADFIRSEFERNARGEVSLHPELRVQRKDGTIFYADVGTAQIVLPEGPVSIGIFRDVTERRTHEEAIRASQEQFRILFENAPIGTALVDGGGHFALANRAFEEMIGYSAEQLRSMSFIDLTHPEDAQPGWGMFEELFRGERESFRIEKRYIRADGRIVWGNVEVTAIRQESGKIEHAITMVEDITERKRLEQERKDAEAQMLQSQKLESLGVLAGGIAHDFNNLLMAILGHVEVCLEELPRDSHLLPSAKEIEIASRRGAELCRQMLAYAGRSKPTTEAVDVNRIVVEMVRLLEVSVSKRANVHFRLADGLPAVWLDATHLRQIVMNLVMNASEAIENNSGCITITTGIRHCDAAFLSEAYVDDHLPDGDYVYVEVSDTGCGMDAATMARIFDPFFTTKFTGRGLGLASVLGIVRGHRGAIKVLSEPAKGSTFTVLFQATSDATPPDEPAHEPKVDWNGKSTILVIDDETGILAVMSRHLERSGFRVLSAEGGPEGIAQFTDHPNVALVILDLAMPQMSGDECLGRLRALKPNIPVIMTSGYDESGVIDKMRGISISGFLQKPFKRSELITMVQRVLGDGANLGTPHQHPEGISVS